MDTLAQVAGMTSLAFDLSQKLIQHQWSIFDRNVRDYGLVRALALETIFFQVRRVVNRIRTHVFHHPGHGMTYMVQEAWLIKKSYTENFNMIAVAIKGAIVAQIAITALSLEYLEDTHWTASAAFVISLVAGLLSVYYACILQQQLSGLHSPEETLLWLTITVRALPHPLIPEMGILEFWHHAQTYKDNDLIPSFNAALLLVVPSILLNWSSVTLLIGIGIYFGMIYAENLGSLRGNNSNLAILLVYVLFTSGALLGYLWPLLQKALESTPSVPLTFQRLSGNGNDHVGDLAQPPGPNNPANGDPSNRNIDLSDHRRVAMDPRPVPPTHYDPSRIQVDAAASMQRQVPGSQSTQLQPLAVSASGSSQPRVDTQRPSHLPTKLAYDAIEMRNVMDALHASVIAQRASLQAQELLLANLRQRENPQPGPRRASL